MAECSPGIDPKLVQAAIDALQGRTRPAKK
jgi:hypothetical protein